MQRSVCSRARTAAVSCRQAAHRPAQHSMVHVVSRGQLVYLAFSPGKSSWPIGPALSSPLWLKKSTRGTSIRNLLTSGICWPYTLRARGTPCILAGEIVLADRPSALVPSVVEEVYQRHQHAHDLASLASRAKGARLHQLRSRVQCQQTWRMSTHCRCIAFSRLTLLCSS